MAEQPYRPQQDSTKPVAYDQYGRPLYAHPPATGQSTEPPVVYMTRPAEPMQQHISPEAQKRHEDSAKKYPGLNLSEGEYVISAVKRHPIGLLSIWSVVILVVVLSIVGAPFAVANQNLLGPLPPGTLASLGMVLLLFNAFFILGGFLATIVYNGNRFYLTNESVTQHIQTSLFSRKEQTISLVNIEDASFRQHGILQTILNYGALRLSTEGDETTYRFNYVSNPKNQVTLLNDAVEAFKNGRPVVND